MAQSVQNRSAQCWSVFAFAEEKRKAIRFFITEVIPIACVPVPKDLSRVKEKVLFNLTKRQLVCFGSGALIGVPLFFLLRSHTGNSVAAMVMILVMLPFFLLAMYERNCEPMEKIAGDFIRSVFLRSKKRPYRTDSFYDAVRRQELLDREVYYIVHPEKAVPGRSLQQHGPIENMIIL